MVSDHDNGPDNDELVDNKQEEFSVENDTYDNACQDVDMEPNDNDDVQDNGKPSEKNTNGNEIARDLLLSLIFQDDTEPAGKDTSKDNHLVKEGEVDNDRRDNNSNEGAVNSIELNVSATISDYDDTDFQRTIDLDELQQQDVSSLQSSDLDLELDADDNTMTKLTAAKLSKSTHEKDKRKKIKEKEKCKHLIQKYRLVLQEDVEDINQERPNVAATNKTSTGIINITKTSFHKKRKESI